MNPILYDFALRLTRDCVSIIIDGFGAPELPNGPAAGTPCKAISLTHDRLQMSIRVVGKAKVRQIRSELPPPRSNSRWTRVRELRPQVGYYEKAICVEGTVTGGTVYKFDATVPFENRALLIDEIVEFLRMHCPDARYFQAAFLSGQSRYRYAVTISPDQHQAEDEPSLKSNYRLLGA